MVSMSGMASAEPLRWASDSQSGAPFVFHDPADQSKLTGFETDLIQALAKQIGREQVFVQNDWDGLIPGLQRGLYDVVIDGIEITPEHRAAVDFSTPYYRTFEQIAVRKDAVGLDSVDALRGHVVGTLKDTLSQRLLEKAGGISLRSYTDETNAYSDLVNGRLDAVMLDAPIALYYAVPDPRLKLVGAPIGGLSYGIALAKGRDVLRAQLDAGLEAMRRDGELRRILARWNMWTPEMASFTGDTTTEAIAPTAWQHWLLATRPAATWRDRLARYASFLPLIGRAALMTVAVSACAMVLAVAWGLVLALARRYGRWPFRMAATGYIEIVRGTPLLIQILFIFYGLPSVGIRLDPFVAGVVALGLNYAAYEAENYRAGLQSVPHGQMEAALALNMTQFQAVRHVVVPQAFRFVVPVMTNDFISLLKDSSLVSVITLTELTQAYVRLSTTYYDYFGTGLLIGCAYLLLGLPFVRLARMAERRLSVGVAQARR
ncbi:ABC transporter permease subunit [Lichenicola cladoniae]|uniref:ABC transporter permease subunit n=1 Tax=Lichenicola cladoniae TaxID=1484109 RepID=A0A6M8HUY4_9PROT|nr:ABC transporter substrate-binding protein/permease [Lichenicola cladoniae]NPD69213.1 ABC transporter permease subunit [Acetobacteraceae bacterium]QKE92379.1 ABC transporter permease subunit [Lichenicola cladoniae]